MNGKLDFAHLPIAVYVFFGLFLAFSITELVFAFLEKEKQRKIVKPFCVAFLAIMVALWRPDAYLVYAALFFGAVGDLLLVFKHKAWTLVWGTMSFFVNHILFIAQYMVLCQPLSWYWYVLTGAIVAAILLCGYHPLHKAIKTPPLAFGGTVYFASIFLDLFWAIVAASLGHFDFCFLNVLGMLFFVGSDIFLVKTLFVRDTKRRDFFIMGSYLIAQAFIAIGFCLTL